MLPIVTTVGVPVLGYIGPGGGIALLGPLVGVVLAVLGAVGMILFWPLRMMLRRLRGGGQQATPATTTQE